MRGRPDSLASAVRQFRELTEASPDGSATRARVLAKATGGSSRGQLRRLAMSAAALAVAAGSVAVAATFVTQRMPAPSVLIPAGVPDPAPLEHLPRARRVIPPDLAGSDQPALDGEAIAYGAAHAAHFTVGQPEQALAAWDGYLRAYPHGRFAPEARFNRAICLVRLHRFTPAAQALAPFAQGRYGAYRRAEAARLMDWMGPALSGAGGR